MSKRNRARVVSEKSSRNTKEKFFTREISGSVTQRLKQINSTRLFKFTHAISDLLTHISTRIYGIALLCFGIGGALIYFLNLAKDGSVVTPIVGLLLACLSIPLLLIEKPLPIFMQEFKPTDYIFFEFFCMKRQSEMEGEKKFPVVLAIIIGLIPAALSIIAPFWQIALIIGVLICVYIGLDSPEFIFLSSLLALPFIRMLPRAELVFALALIIALLAFIRKVIYGRRVFFIERYDIIIGLIMLLILISGIFVKGVDSFAEAIKMIIFSVGYMLAGNIITNRRLAELSAGSLIFSGALASIVSIVQFFTIIYRTGINPTIADLAPIISRQDGVAALLMVSTILSVGMIRQSVTFWRWTLFVSSICTISALIISGEFFVITALIFSALAYGVIKSNRIPGIILPVLLAVSMVGLLLPVSVLEVIFKYSPSILSARSLFDLWENSVILLANHPLIGIGVGKGSFADGMATIGVYGYPDSSNLFIEMGLKAGLLVPILFIMLLITRMSHRSMHYLYVRNSQIARMSNLSGACLFGLLAFGMLNYLWSDMSTYYLFWCLFGIGSACLRVAKRDYDDRVIYYEESSALDSSVIDIEIG